MTDAQAQAAEDLWGQRASRDRLARIAAMAPTIGLDPAQVRLELQCAPNPEGAWETMVSLRAIEAEDLHQRSVACAVLADIKAQRGDAAALGLLREEALLKLKKLAKTARVVPGIKVQILPGAGAHLHDICRAMAAEPVATIEEELRNPRLPNPACPAKSGALDRGYCTCRYTAWKEDWVIDRPQR